MALGIGLIVTMIIVASSIGGYGRPVFGDDALNVVDFASIGEVTSAPGELVITRIERYAFSPDVFVPTDDAEDLIYFNTNDPDFEDADSAIEDVPTIEFGHELTLPLTDND